MWKVYIYKVLFVISYVFLGCFILVSGYDSYNYFFGYGKYGSAPLDLHIAVWALMFFLPAIISFLIAHKLKLNCIK